MYLTFHILRKHLTKDFFKDLEVHPFWPLKVRCWGNLLRDWDISSAWDINIYESFSKMFYDKKLLHACIHGLGVNKNGLHQAPILLELCDHIQKFENILH